MAAISTAASTGLQYALTPKPKKPAPIDRGKLDDLRFSLPAYGAAIPKVWGTFRCAPTWFWHTEAVDRPVTTPGSQGGGKGGGAPPTADEIEHRYFKNMAGVFHDGLIQSVSRIWFDEELVINANFANNFAETSSTRYEAEHGILTGGASVATQVECSGGKKVTGIGSGGSVTIHCDVLATATYEVAVGYTSTVDRAFRVSVNGGPLTELTCPASGGAGVVAYKVLSLSLTSGANTIAFSNPAAASPDLDSISIATALTFTEGADPRGFTGITRPGRVAPDDPDVMWVVSDEQPDFSDTDGGLTNGGYWSFTLAKWGNAVIRIYPGSEEQLPDSLIESVKGAGNVSAHRGLAYIVIEGLWLQGRRVPNVTIEFSQGTRSASAIITDVYGLVGESPANLELSALNGLILGDATGFDPGTYSAITWSSLVNATQTAGGAITKTSGTNNTWNARATNGSSISAGTDAAIRFTAGSTGTYLLGFSTTATPGATLPNPYNQVLFGVVLNLNSNPSQESKNAIQMSLGGSNNSNDVGVWAPGDRFQVEIRNGKGSVYQNGLLLTSFTPPPLSYPLFPVWMGYATGGGPSAASFATGANIGSEPIIENSGALVLDSQREAGELIEELMTRFQFLMPEVDGKVKAVMLNAASDLTLTHDEIRCYRGDGLPPPVQISRKNPLLFPKKTIINYSDAQQDYHNASQVETRLYGPQHGTLNVNLAMVETANNMKKLAVTLSNRAEVEGQVYKFTAGPKYKHIHQGTVLTIDTEDATHDVRVTDFRPDLPAGLGEVEAVRQASIFSPNAVGGTVGVEPPIVPVPGNTKGVLLDGTLLRAADAGDGSLPVAYVAMCGRGSGTWPAGLMHKEFPLNSGDYTLDLVALQPAGIGIGSGAQTTLDAVSVSGKPGSSFRVDGTIARSGEATYAGARDAATGTSVDLGGIGLLYAENSLDTGTYQVQRSLIHFDTSSIPDSATILAAELRLYGKSKSTDTDDTVAVCASQIVSDVDYAVADFDLFGSTRLSADYPISGLSVNAYSAFTLNAAGIAVINKSGSTKLAIRAGKDLDNITPTARRFMNFSAADAAGASEDPILRVTYAVPGLNAVSDASVWDRSSSMTIDFYSNTELQSVTEQQVLNDPELNLLAVKNPTTHGVEYVQFVTAVAGVATAPFITRYIVSTFLRGRAASDFYLSDHSAQDEVVVIDSAVQPHRLPITDIGRTLKLKFQTSGQALDQVPVVEVPFQGNSLKALAPSGLRGVRDSEGDLLIRWDRRSRIGAGLRPFSDVPIGEERERYRVEIYDGSTLKRTMDVLTGTQMAAFLFSELKSEFDGVTHNTFSLPANYGARSIQEIPGPENFIEANLETDMAGGLFSAVGLQNPDGQWRGVAASLNAEFSAGSFGATLDAGSTIPYVVSLGAYGPALGPFYQKLSVYEHGTRIFSASSEPAALDYDATFGWSEPEANRGFFRIRFNFVGSSIRIQKAHTTNVPFTTIAVSNQAAIFPYFVFAAANGGPSYKVSAVTMTTNPLPGTIYSAAQQTEDFGSTQSAITVRVRQFSAVVGYGFHAGGTI